MDRVQLLERKIFLKKQHIEIIRDQISDMEKERKQLLKQKRAIEQRISKGNGTMADHAELRAINNRLKNER